MNQLVSNVVDVLQELRIDLQDFMWLIAEQLRIDSALVQASDQVRQFLPINNLDQMTF